MNTVQTPRRLVVLGSTGSIGVNTLNVVQHLNAIAKNGDKRFAVVGLAARRRVDVLIDQARRFNVPAVAVADRPAATEVQRLLPDTHVFAGHDAAERMMNELDATDLSAAVVGSAGLPATLSGIRRGMRIGLANKETLVAAGEMVKPLVRRHEATLIPVDSEHSAIFQCLASDPAKRSRIKRIVLTASGGPFRKADKRALQNATVEEALNHPTWNMGKKITIDSATMVNKALEIIEAHWLFDLPPEKIRVIIHPQSVVHSFVEFEDHSILAQLGPPDMQTPIQYALTYPDRAVGCSQALDWSTLSTLAFEQPDVDRFPSLALAYHVIRAGGTAGAIFNAANEAAVGAFLNRQIRFGRIVELVTEALSAIERKTIDSLDTVLEADRQARTFVNERIRQAVAQKV